MDALFLMRKRGRSVTHSRTVLCLVTLCWVSGCTRIFFFPEQKYVIAPSELGLKYEDVFLDTGDRVRVHGWFLPAEGPVRGSVLHLHGNAENISTHIASVYWLPQQGFNVFLLDYRGYGQSAGSPSVSGALRDIEASLDWLFSRVDLGAGVIVFGQSLGGSLGICAVAQSRHREQVRALVIESAFSSYRSIFREKLAEFWVTWPFQWLLGLLVDNSFAPVECAGTLPPIPKLLIQAEDDPIVPAHHVHKLYDAVSKPCELWLSPRGGHIAAFQDAELRARLLRFIESSFSRARTNI